MLTRELAIATFENDQLIPDRLTRKSHAEYLTFAEKMLDIYRNGIGRTRKSLHSDVHRVFVDQPECPGRRILAFCKLLDDVSDYSKGDRKQIAQLRISVFRAAAKLHPLVTDCDSLFVNSESQTRNQIAKDHAMCWPELSDRLFSDLIEYHELKSFSGYPDAAALLSRYNVAQTQVILYDAIKLSIKATCDFKQILRYAKLARLMHRITKRADHYLFELDGPASVLNNTHRYGISMAKFLPGLLSCRGWSMLATLRPHSFRPPIRYYLDDQCGLVSSVERPNEFDSEVEEAFANDWGSDPRNGWHLERETEILHQGQSVFFPDFVFKHVDGRLAMLEIIGFWTPEYLSQKAKTLDSFHQHNILLAVANPLKDKLVIQTKRPIVFYKKTIAVAEVLEKLETSKASD